MTQGKGIARRAPWGCVPLCLRICLPSFLTLCLALAAAPAAFAQPNLGEVDRFLKRHLEDIPTPGFSVVIVVGDRTVFARGYGVEQVGGTEPMTEHSSVAIGSLTKSLTALAILGLVESGQIDLDQPANTYLPWFRTADRRSGEITIRTLLNNTSGIPSRDHWLFSRDTSEQAIEKGVRRLSSVPLVRAPGGSFEYSNENWSLLGLVISEVTGVPYSTHMQRAVFDPLAMTRSTTALDRFEPLGVLYGHFAGIERVHPARPRFLAEALPAGSELRASAADMGHYLAMLLSGGEFGGRQILSSESVATLFEPASSFLADMPEMGSIGVQTGYGMGWAITEADGRTIVHHGGDAIVMGSWAALDLDQRIGACVLYNGPLLDGYRFPSRLWVANNLLHLIQGEPLTDFGRATETDPTLNDFELASGQVARYVGPYLSTDGLRAEVIQQADRLTLQMSAGDLEFRYEVDFLSASSAALRNLSGTALTSFLMTPEGKVTGFAGGLPGGVYRKRSEAELARLARMQEVRSPDGRVVFSLPKSWRLNWDGNSFEAQDPDRPSTSLRGGLLDTPLDEVVETRRKELGQNPVQLRSESVGNLQWQQLIWSEGQSEGQGDARKQGLIALTQASGITFEVALSTEFGKLTAQIRDVLLPLMAELQLRGSL